MATVRDTDLPDLLVSLGYQVKRIGRYYTTQEKYSICSTIFQSQVFY